MSIGNLWLIIEGWFLWEIYRFFHFTEFHWLKGCEVAVILIWNTSYVILPIYLRIIKSSRLRLHILVASSITVPKYCSVDKNRQMRFSQICPDWRGQVHKTWMKCVIFSFSHLIWEIFRSGDRQLIPYLTWGKWINLSEINITIDCGKPSNCEI